jgi:hypothetical protein
MTTGWTRNRGTGQRILRARGFGLRLAPSTGGQFRRNERPRTHTGGA